MFYIECVTDDTRQAVIAFLKQHESYCLFLLGNIENYGLKLSAQSYSGNFKIIRSCDKIVCVFCLTRAGSLLIQSVVSEPIFELVLTACLKEFLPLKGLVGEWEFCHLFWQFLKRKKIVLSETFVSKEILYSIDLSESTPCLQQNVRFLAEKDYAQWKPLRLAYLKEEGFPNNLSDEHLQELFVDKCQQKIAWGYFTNGQLVSLADLNAKSFEVGQLGGVYTDPCFRRKGYSKAVISQLLWDIKHIHHLRKLIIFTRKTNEPAKQVYKALGAHQIGYFALLFSN